MEPRFMLLLAALLHCLAVTANATSIQVEDPIEVAIDVAMGGTVEFDHPVPADERAYVIVEVSPLREGADTGAKPRYGPYVELERAPIDANGAFSFSRPEGGAKVRLEVEGDYAYSKRQEFDIDAAGATGVVVSARIGAHVTLVLDPDHVASGPEVEAIAGATLLFTWIMRGDNSGSIVRPIYDFTLAADGTATRKGVAPSAYRYEPVPDRNDPRHDRWKSQRSSLAPFRVVDGAEFEALAGRRVRVEVPIERAAALVGSITDALGQPVEGATVAVTDRVNQRFHSESRVYMRKSGTDGSFAFDALPHGVDGITVKADGFVTASVSAAEARARMAANESLSIALERLGSIVVQVRRQGGQPANGSSITAYLTGSPAESLAWPEAPHNFRAGCPRPRAFRTAIADENGIARLAELPLHEHALQVGDSLASDDVAVDLLVEQVGAVRSHIVPTSEGTSATITLEDSQRTSISVAGVPPTASALLVSVSAKSGTLIATSGPPYGGIVLDQETGLYEVSLVPGEYGAQAWALLDGVRFSADKTGFVVNASGSGATHRSVKVAFRDPCVAGGTVRRRLDSRPVAGATVTLTSEPPADRIRRVTETDSRGRFRIANLQPGHYRLVVEDGVHARTIRRVRLWPGNLRDRSDMAIKVNPGARIEVFFRSPDGTPANGSVELLDASGRPIRDFATRRDEATGLVSLGPLSRTQDVTVRAEYRTPADGGARFRLMGEKTVLVGGGFTSILVFEVPDKPVASVRGRVRFAGTNETARWLTITLERDGELVALDELDEEGRFELHTMHVGDAQLRLWAASDSNETRAARSVDVRLQRGARDLGDIDVPAGRIVGSVSAPAGTDDPLPQGVAAFRADDRERTLPVAIDLQDHTGMFSLELLGDGQYEVVGWTVDDDTGIGSVNDAIVPRTVEISAVRRLADITLEAR